MLDLLLVGILFAASSGIWQLLGERAWPPPLLLVLLLTCVLALRAAEARGWSGIQAVGQAALHVIAVAQLGAALVLLALPVFWSCLTDALGFASLALWQWPDAAKIATCCLLKHGSRRRPSQRPVR